MGSRHFATVLFALVGKAWAPATATAAQDNYNSAPRINHPGAQLPEDTSIGGDADEDNFGFTIQTLPDDLARARGVRRQPLRRHRVV